MNYKYKNGGLTSTERISSIAIAASVLVLAILCGIVFALFSDEYVPTPGGTGGTTTVRPIDKPVDSGKIYPYATVTSKTDFVSSAGGKNLSDVWLNSEFAVLVRLSDMSTVAYRGADEAIYPASMTKIMTVVTALDLIEDLDDTYLLTWRVLATVPEGSSTAWLKNYVNSYVSVRDLLYGITYRSGADAVLCLIDYFGLEVGEFVYLMNEKAAEIGLENTKFGGAIGMDDEENRSTCRDIAALMAYAMENPFCHALFGGTAYSLDCIDLTYYNSTLSTALTNIGTTPDKLLGSDYTLLAAKSGLEDKAGYCLASYIRNDVTGELFVLVTAKAPRSEDYPPNKNPISDMVKIFDLLNP